MDKPNWQRLKTDPAFRIRMEKRAATIAAMRSFFESEGFMEVETPTVVALPGMEPHLDPLRTEVTRHDGTRFAAHLITSPEYAMKKLLAGGLEKIFEFARSYRNGEPWDGTHNPEFTMLEWYRANADYTAIMSDLERMVSSAARAVCGSEQITYQGMAVDLSTPWERMTVAEAFIRYTGIDLGRAIGDPPWFRAEVEARGVVLTPNDTWDDVFFKIFLRDIDPKLGLPDAAAQTAVAPEGITATSAPPVARPVILYEYPRSMAALARLKSGDPRYAERFEAYVAGMELANAFSELSDAAEQRARLEEERALRQTLGRHDYGLDEQFLEAVGQMPPSAGIAMGVDRLVLLLTDAPGIRDVLFFPAADLFA